jgi:hypothetical protein
MFDPASTHRLIVLALFVQRHESVRLLHVAGTMLAARNGILIALCIVAPGTPRAFIYFQFLHHALQALAREPDFLAGPPY